MAAAAQAKPKTISDGLREMMAKCALLVEPEMPPEDRDCLAEEGAFWFRACYERLRRPRRCPEIFIG